MSESSDPPLWAELWRSRPRRHHRHSWQQRAGRSPAAPQQVAETSPPNRPKPRWGGGTCLPFVSLCTEGHYQLISGAGDSGNTSHNGCRARGSAWYVLMCRDVGWVLDTTFASRTRSTEGASHGWSYSPPLRPDFVIAEIVIDPSLRARRGDEVHAVPRTVRAPPNSLAVRLLSITVWVGRCRVLALVVPAGAQRQPAARRGELAVAPTVYGQVCAVVPLASGSGFTR
jgi:hypothetical protein